MMQSIQTLTPAVVAAYDELLYLRSLLVHNPVSELLLALYFIASSCAAILLFVYWIYCLLQLFQCPGGELSDMELESLRPERGLLTSLFHFVLPSATLLH